MSLIQWNPTLAALSRWPSIWDDEEFGTHASSSNNLLDVYETENEVVVKANVAGAPTDAIDVTFEKGVLFITADFSSESDEKKKYYSKSSWKYSYKVAVPGMIDYAKEPDVRIKDGVLTLNFKKTEQSKPRKLTIKTDDSQS